MANKVRADRVKETTDLTGQDNATLTGNPTGFATFGSACADGSTFDYTITEDSSANWETGVGTYIAATNTVERTIIVASSNSNNKVTFGSNLKYIFITVNSSTHSLNDKTLSKATALSIALGG
jgi:hypothetical protein